MFSGFRCRRKDSGLDGNRQFFSVSRSSAAQTFASAVVSAPSARAAGNAGDDRKHAGKPRGTFWLSCFALIKHLIEFGINYLVNFFRDLSVNLHLRPMAIEDSSFIYSSIQLAGSPPRLSNDLLVVVRQNA